MIIIKTFGGVVSKDIPQTNNASSTIGSPTVISSGNSMQDRLRNLEKARENNQPKIIQPVQPSPVVKPILNPSVKAVLSDDEQTLIGESLKKLGFSDFDLTNTEKSRILIMRNEIKITDHQFITEYGSDVSSEEIIKKLSEIINSAFSDGVRSSLNKIMAAIKRVDIDAIFNKSFLKSFFSRSITTKEEYNILEAEINNEISTCKKALESLKKHIPEFDAVELETDKQFRMLSVLIVAAQLRIDDEKSKMASQTTAVEFFAKQNLQDLQDAVSRFERRIHNLMLIRQTILMRMSQLRLEENNFLTLIDQTNDILTLVIPTWKQQMISVFSSKANGNSAYNDLLNIQKELLEKMSNATGAKNDSV